MVAVHLVSVTAQCYSSKPQLGLEADLHVYFEYVNLPLSLVEQSDLVNQLEYERIHHHRRHQCDVVKNDILGAYVNFTEVNTFINYSDLSLNLNYFILRESHVAKRDSAKNIFPQ